jgi:phosphopantothenoylcysteine decarboxylase/phosphopantothenate--cysteine ligase
MHRIHLERQQGVCMKKHIVLGVTGSISAYKSIEIVRRLIQNDFHVSVVMTKNATELIPPLTFETISHNTVYTSMFEEGSCKDVTHIKLASESDLILVAPASYNLLGKVSAGIADDLLTSILAAAPPEKVLFAPAMNVHMYENPAMVFNHHQLLKRGYRFIEPDEGPLACGTSGKGRLKDVDSIVQEVKNNFCPALLSGKKVLITAGSTREYLDPIRYISNTSSGRMGFALAKACHDMGADVTLIAANSHLENPSLQCIRVETVEEMHSEVMKVYPHVDIVFMAAAVSDFKPMQVQSGKIKKENQILTLEFKQNRDILAELGDMKKHQMLIGFSAESECLLERTKEKRVQKNADIMIGNDLSNFSSIDGTVWIVSQEHSVKLQAQSKEELATMILQTLTEQFGLLQNGSWVFQAPEIL